jgi:hypothetical protein
LTLDIWFFLIAGPAVVFAGVSKGGFGSGAAFAAASMLALVIDPGLALGVMLPLLMVIDAASLKPYWRKWSWHEARLLILGGLPGVVLGAAFYRVADQDLLRLLIGAVSIGFVVFQVGTKRGYIPVARNGLPDWAGLLSGLVAGFTSFVSHAGGPPAAIYLLSRKLPKTRYQGTTVLVFWTLNIVKFVPYTFLGIFSVDTLKADLVLVPFALLGTWLGVRAHKVVPERLFFGLTYALLLITGTKLIWDAVQ